MVSWEDVLWLIDISAELEVVDLSDISLVKVLPDKELEEILIRRDDLELFHHSSELLHSDVAGLGSVIILELWLDENSLVDNLSSDGSKDTQESLHLALGEVGSGLGVLDNSIWVNFVRENRVNVAAEI